VRQFISRAKIILLASHSIALCRAMCTKALILNKERSFFGGIEEGWIGYAHLRGRPRVARRQAAHEVAQPLQRASSISSADDAQSFSISWSAWL